jgi:predicted phage baseplate assembly protein
VICTDEQRRAQVRAKGRNGIDLVNVGADRRELTVSFFGETPADLGATNFGIEGGTRITGITVVSVASCEPDDDPDTPGQVRLTVDRAGDLSTYRLHISGVDGFDPRYSCIDFRFVTGCDDLDCSPACDCPDESYPPVEIDYLTKDYASLRQVLLDRLSLTMPGWTERHVPDIGIALVELLAYEGDRLSYRQDAVATEAYLDTARLRTSVRRHARLVDYRLHDGAAARAWVCVEVGADVTLPHGVQFAAGDEIFESAADVDVPLQVAHNSIDLWTWGNRQCCLPAGATHATLVDGAAAASGPEAAADTPAAVTPPSTTDAGRPAPGGRTLALAPGDVLIFEETAGPKTGAEADRDVSHRQAVRLTSVTPAVDDLYGQPVLEVAWDRDDALRFDLCVSARCGPDCVYETVAVARGNVVLVEHGGGGHTETFDPPVEPPGESTCEPACFGCSDIGDLRRAPYPPIPVRFGPTVGAGEVTQHTELPVRTVVARAQGSWLRGLPDRARDRLAALLTQVATTPLGEADIAYLTTLFGAPVLRRLRLSDDAAAALRAMLARFDELLAAKLARLDELIGRACSGDVLTAACEGWEIAAGWGEAEGLDLDPQRPAFWGPAAAVEHTDPRTALPAITIEDQFGQQWYPRRDLLDCGPDELGFVGETDDAGAIHVRFGDSRNGAAFPTLDAAPPTGGPTVTARYRLGNGTAGNVGAETINRFIATGVRGLGISRVRNPLPATGGVDPEPVAEARVRAPLDARLRQLRAVTAADYADLAAHTPGVQRAAADLAWTGSWYEAQVAVDPLGLATAPDWLIDDTRRILHRYRKIGHDLSVSAALAVPLDVRLCVEVEPDHIAGHVRAALLQVLGSGRTGYFHPDRLTFGTPVRVSGIVAAASAVSAVRTVTVTVLERLFGPPATALDTGVLPIRALEIARCDNDPTRPENGRLQLDLVGGR